MTEDELIRTNQHISSAIANALKHRNLVARLSCRIGDQYATVIKVEHRGKQGQTNSELRQP